jgi:hypothetical protein
MQKTPFSKIQYDGQTRKKFNGFKKHHVIKKIAVLELFLEAKAAKRHFS